MYVLEMNLESNKLGILSRNGEDNMTEKEIEIVINALAGVPTLTSSAFADKVEKILRNSMEEDKHK